MEMAEQVAEIFTEVIVAPATRTARVEVLATQEEHPRAARARGARPPRSRSSRSTAARCSRSPTASRPRATTRPTGPWPPATRCPTAELAELAFAWRACRAVKSNAILLAKDGASVGVGMGQVNRVDSAKLAVERAGAERARGCVRRVRRVLPVPRRPGDPDRGGRQGRGPAGRFGPRRAGRRGREEGGRDDVLHGDAALLPLSRARARPRPHPRAGCGLGLSPRPVSRDASYGIVSPLCSNERPYPMSGRVRKNSRNPSGGSHRA